MTATLDKYGRILIPKKIREAAGIAKDTILQLKQEGNQIIIEPLRSDAISLDENGFFLFRGYIEQTESDWIIEDRKERDRKLLGL
ncbi:MAG: AbrB/MazE/SpoVT family DNA-binding domain-containing protein [Bacteroidota bacterium]